MIERFEKFSFLVSEVSRYWHVLAKEEMDLHGLKGPHAVYFTTIYQYPEGVTASKLAEICSRDKSDVSRALSQFEKKGLIEKVNIANSTYKIPVKLTKSGILVAEHINQKSAEAVSIVGKDLSEKEREIFYSSLESICNNLRSLSKKGLLNNKQQHTDNK